MHILGVAHDLFHFEGIRATGIDLVAEGMYGSAQALGAAGPPAHGPAAAEALIDAAVQLRDQPSTPAAAIETARTPSARRTDDDTRRR